MYTHICCVMGKYMVVNSFLSYDDGILTMNNDELFSLTFYNIVTMIVNLNFTRRDNYHLPTNCYLFVFFSLLHHYLFSLLFISIN